MLIVVLGIIFLLGLMTLAQKVAATLPSVAQLLPHPSSSPQAYALATIKDADFDYLVPAKNAGWDFDASKAVYDKQKGVVRYQVTLTNAKVNVVFSQQKFPADLKDRRSAKFQAFINDSNVVRSQDAGRGTLYFMQAQENGVPSAAGANAIIFATDDVLMFGQVGKLLGYDGWAQLLAAMTPH